MNNLRLLKFTVLTLLLGIVSVGGLLAQNAPMSGESFNLDLGNLDPGQTVVITFDVTVDANAAGQVCNQGTVSGNNFTSVLTDDSDDPTSGEDPTCTPVTAPPQELDFGDAPDPTYATLVGSNGARHVIFGNHLGPTVDAEPDGQPTALADGDDINGPDEDGVIFPLPLIAGDPAAQVLVDYGAGPVPGQLDAWIDFNGNGVFDHPAEHLWGGTSQPLVLGPNTLSFAVPALAVPGQSFARFRLSIAGNLLPTGLADDGEVEDYQVQIEEPVIFPFMTMWAVNDDTDGKLQYYTLDVASPFLNIEGNIELVDENGVPINDDKDFEDLIIDSPPLNGNSILKQSVNFNGATIYIVNNVGTSTIYSLDYSEFDGNDATPVTATRIGSTGLPSDPGGSSPNEISSLLVHNETLYGMGKRSKILYEINKTNGLVTPVCTLSVAGDFRTDGMTYRPDDNGTSQPVNGTGTVYLLKTNDSGGESEIWKFDNFPGPAISHVVTVTSSGKLEALSAHPDGFLYASDLTNLYKISVPPATPYIGVLADYTVDIEGMDYFYEMELIKTIVPTRAFIPIGPVPVELVSFTAETRENKVILNWETATEVNNYGFEVERQVGSKQSAVGNWEKVGFVDGHGNSNSPKVYHFTDGNPTGGTKFSYRLKQIDNDGSYEYSDIVEVEFVPTEFALYQNYPNPFNPSTKIKYSIPVESEVTIKVFDILGNEIMTLVSEKQQAGTYDVEFSTNGGGNDFVSGIYIYQIKAGEFTQTKKMLLMK